MKGREGREGGKGGNERWEESVSGRWSEVEEEGEEGGR